MPTRSRLSASKTTPQIGFGLLPFYDGELSPRMPKKHDGAVVSWETYREIRKDPTVSLARELLSAMVIAGRWAAESTVRECCEEDRILAERCRKFLEDYVLPLRGKIVEPAVTFGYIDYGWCPFEVILRYDEDTALILADVKPLLVDLTRIMVDAQTGQFVGYRQDHAYTGQQVDLWYTERLHLCFKVEGTNWYGEGLLETVRRVVERYAIAEDTSAKFDKKVTGIHWAVHFPPGTSKVDGIKLDNQEVAQRVLNRLESQGSVTVPNTIADFVDQLNSGAAEAMYAWRIVPLAQSTSQHPGYNDRLRYLDALKVRAMGAPERTMLEGQFGTKAEAGVHADMAITNMQLVDQSIAYQVTEQLVHMLLEINFGTKARDLAEITVVPLVDEQRRFFEKLYEAQLSSGQEIQQVDWRVVREKLGVPINSSNGVSA